MAEFLKELGKKEVVEIKWVYAGHKVRDIYNRLVH
jgi:hypothetical protein